MNWGSIPTEIQAIIWLLIAWLVAAIARSLVKKLAGRFLVKKTEEDGDRKKEAEGTVSLFGNLAFAVVFFLFLPGALDKLGMSSVSAPIASMASEFLNFLPNIVAACIVLAFGVFLAKLVLQLLTRVLKKTKIDALQEKCGIRPGEGNGFSDILAKIAYAIVLIVFVVASLQILNISAISAPAVDMVSQVFSFIPKLFAAIIVVAFGAFLAGLVEKLLRTILGGTGLDQYTASVLPQKNGKQTASGIIAVIAKVVINIIFIVAGVKILDIEVLTNVGSAIIGYMPQVLAAAVIFIIAWIAAPLAEKAILKANAKAGGFAVAAKAGVYVLAGFIVLSQLGIAPHIINILFVILAGAVGIAFAISFGIGGQEWAKQTMSELSRQTRQQLGPDDETEKKD